jgi:toxin CcdB
MMQLEVPNPLIRARRAYPYIVVLQADIAAVGRERVVAFLAAREHVGAIGGRLMPVVKVGGRAFVVLMPSITNVPVSELRRPIGDLAPWRGEIVDALDWLFLRI